MCSGPAIAGLVAGARLSVNKMICAAPSIILQGIASIPPNFMPRVTRPAGARWQAASESRSKRKVSLRGSSTVAGCRV